MLLRKQISYRCRRRRQRHYARLSPCQREKTRTAAELSNMPRPLTEAACCTNVSSPGPEETSNAQHPAGDLLKTDTAASRPWIRPVNSCPSSQQVSELSHNHFLLACHNERAISQQVEHVLHMNGLPVANKLAHNETYKIQGLQLIAREQCLSSVRKSKRRCCGTPGEMVFTVMYRTFHAFMLPADWTETIWLKL